MAINKPEIPSTELPETWGGIQTPYTEEQTQEGYPEAVPTVVDGGNLNFEKKGLFENIKYLRTIVDFIKNLPTGKALITNNNNQLDYGSTLPNQTGNAGKYLTTDGTNEYWGGVNVAPYVDEKIKAVSSLPAEIEPGVWYGTTSEVSEDSTGIDYVVETYVDEDKWCRVYKSGWIEQGGSIEVAKNSKGTIDLLKPYPNTKYTLTSNFYASTETSTYNNTMKLCKSSENQLSYDNSSLGHIMIVDWETKGKGA